VGGTLMTENTQYSHDGMNDQLTQCAAPPMFYSHLDRMISGSNRTSAPLTLLSISIPTLSPLDQILAIAHVINQLMRKEDLCGRMGNFQFVVVLSGNLNDGKKLVERIRIRTDIEFATELVQWTAGETSLEILYRLDLAVEFSL
jgi:GGDEF domain-containing protein